MPPGKSISPTGILLMFAVLGPLLGYLLFLMYRAQKCSRSAPPPGW